jgi:iron complex outermembrane receptor protein
MKKYLFIISFICTTILGNAQIEFSGYIKDKDDSTPIIGANVYIPELNRGVATDGNGFFKIDKLPSGHFHVQFSFIGYSTRVEHLDFNDENISLNIELTKIVIQSQEVVISGGGYMSQHENAIKIETINPKEINELNNISFIKSLSSIPGVDMISKGPGVASPVIRGLSLSNVLVLNNGIRLENFQFSENHPFMIDEFGIDKVEVIKGPASLLYGSDAIGGVINIIREKNETEGKTSGDVNTSYYSNTNGYQANLGLKGSKNDIFFGFRAGTKSHEDYTDGSGVEVPNSRFNEYGVKLNAGINKSFGRAVLYYDYNRMKLGMILDHAIPLIETNSRKNDYWFQDLTNHLITLKNTAFVNDFKLNLNLSYQLNTRKLQESVVAPEHTEVHMQLNTLFYELKVFAPTSKKQDIIFGLQGRNQRNENFEAPVHVLPDYTSYEFSVYGLYQRDFGDKVHFQTGLRYDLRNINMPEQIKTSHSHEEGHEEQPTELMPEFRKEYSNLSGSIGATFELSEYLLLRTNYASAYRTPNIAELSQDGMHGNRYEQGDRDLLSQRSHEGDLSIHVHSKHITFDIATFYNHVDNFIFLSPTADTLDDGDEIYRYMQENAHLYGVETGFSIKPWSFFQYKFSYAYLVGEKLNGDPLPFIPQNKLNNSIVFTYSKLSFFKDINLSLSGNYAFEQNNPALFETKTGDYFLLDASLGFTIPISKQAIRFGLNAHNMLDAEYFDHLSTLKPLGYYNMGRSFSFSLSYLF